MFKKIKAWILGWKKVEVNGVTFRVRDFVEFGVQCLNCKTIYTHNEYETNSDGDFKCIKWDCRSKNNFKEYPITKNTWGFKNYSLLYKKKNREMFDLLEKNKGKIFNIKLRID